MCNKEGKCSGEGEPHLISELQDNTPQPTTDGSLSGMQIVSIVLSALLGLGVLLFVVVFVFFLCKWRREVKIRKLGLKPLGDRFDLDDSNDSHDYEPADSGNEHSYDRVDTNVHEETT